MIQRNILISQLPLKVIMHTQCQKNREQTFTLGTIRDKCFSWDPVFREDVSPCYFGVASSHGYWPLRLLRYGMFRSNRSDRLHQHSGDWWELVSFNDTFHLASGPDMIEYLLPAPLWLLHHGLSPGLFVWVSNFLVRWYICLQLPNHQQFWRIESALVLQWCGSVQQ